MTTKEELLAIADGKDQSVKNYIEAVAELPRLTPAQTAELLAKAKAGDGEAKKRVAEAFLYIVVRMANDYLYTGRSFQELVSEGTVGLLDAIGRDFTQSFAGHVRGFVEKALQKATTGTSRQGVNQALAFIKEFLSENKMLPTVEDLAKVTDFSTKQCLSILDQFKNKAFTTLSEKFASARTMEDAVLDEVHNSSLSSALFESLSTLTDRERKVMRLWSGMEDGQHRTYSEIAPLFNVTPTRISQIVAKALRKLRHPSRSRRLKDFL
jgi:RNA polymerase primary sigma factor